MDRDQAMVKGLLKILDEGTFPLKAREVTSFAAVYTFVKDELPVRLKASAKADDKGKKADGLKSK